MGHSATRLLANFLISLTLLLMLGCGGGGGGGSGAETNNPETTFTKTLNRSNDINGGLLVSTVHDSKHQFLHHGYEINGSGYITKLRFSRTAETSNEITCPNLSIRLGHTDITELSSTFSANINTGSGSLTTVLENATLIIPAGLEQEWFEINFTTPFYYNQVDSLIVEIEKSTPCSGEQFFLSTATDDIRTVVSFSPNITDGSVDHDQVSANLERFAQPWMQFVFAGGENSIYDLEREPVVIVGTYLNPGVTRMQQIHLANEINGVGSITGIAVRRFRPKSPSSTASSYTATVRLGHTAISALGTSFADNYNVEPPVVVADTVSFSVPATDAGWIWIPLPDSSFYYNGTDNLIVDISIETASAGTLALASESFDGRLMTTTDVNPETGTMSNLNFRTRFRFAGSPISVITDGQNSTSSIFNPNAAGRMGLYRATELGSAGTITSLSCRLSGTSDENVYDNYQIIIGHSATDSLDSIAENNFISQHIALDGSVTVPAGLSPGDWLEIQLTSPFEYDGLSNLVIWMGTTSVSNAAFLNTCRLSSTDTDFTEQTGIGAPGAPTLILQNRKLDMQFIFE